MRRMEEWISKDAAGWPAPLPWHDLDWLAYLAEEEREVARLNLILQELRASREAR